MLKPLFKFFQKLEKTFGVKVHFIETGIVLLILSATAVLSGKGWVEWERNSIFVLCKRNRMDIILLASGGILGDSRHNHFYPLWNLEEVV